MGRSRFPGKPLKFQNRKRVSILSGAVYNESGLDCHPPGRSALVSDSVRDKEEEEKKENDSECDVNIVTEEKILDEIENIQDNNNRDSSNNNRDSSKSPVRTRSQNKMDPPKEKIKPVKKTVTFGTVESCEDIYLPLKRVPIKHHAPLVPIIKKKSALKHTEYSTFNSILKPAKLTDLSSKSSSEHHEGYLRKNLNPLSKPMNKFSQLTENRSISPPPRNTSPTYNRSKFSLLSKSGHSSRTIKPNIKFSDGEQTATTSSVLPGKVLKKPKLKQLVFNNIIPDDDENQEDDKVSFSEKSKEKHSLTTSRLFKDKTGNSFPNLNSGSRKSVHDLFYEKETECSQDENSNETPDKSKSSESDKEERRGHALRKLVDISDASSSSSTSSGSESEDSWDSDSPEGSADDQEKPQSPSPEKEKASASQLLSGKVIIREARLQLNSPAPFSAGLDGPFSTLTSATTNNSPSTVTCGVCGAVRFYRFVKQTRKFGIYSCESCRKFISKMLKKEKMSHRTGPVVMQCFKGEGNCLVPPIVRSQQWKLLKCTNKARCPACWLKMCLKAFQVPSSIKAGLTAMLPPYMRPQSAQTGPTSAHANPLRITSNTCTTQSIFSSANTENETKVFMATKPVPGKKTTEEVEDVTKKETSAQEEKEDFSANRKRRLTRIKVRKKDKQESKVVEDPKRQKVELKGPRVKHVCRSASIVLGQPIATFPAQAEKEKLEKAVASDEDATSLIDIKEHDILSLEPSRSDSEADTENKAPLTLLASASEVAVCEKEPEVEQQTETKKRKLEPLVPKPPSRSESSEDENVLELIPKKTVMRPLSNITNVRGRSKYGQNHPELICVDFWESYDPDEVCNSGFGLIGSAAFTVVRACFLCGSAGKEKMLVCSSCCEWYHSWCAEDAVGGSGWMCARCVSCAACSRAAARLRCRSCERHFHALCLPAAPPDHRSDWPQICSACLKCKSCDSSRVSKFVGSLPFCGPCFKLRQKGNYCPLCQACYRDNDFDSKMMECGWCGRWVHASCEGLSGEGYQLLSALPPSIEYICCKCMPQDPPWRKMLTEHLKARLLHLLKQLAKNKKACALLKLTPHKNTPVPNKPYRLMSPQAIRKLHFEDVDEAMKTTSETKVYRNTAKGRKSKMDENNAPQMWHCPSLLSDVNMEDENMPHPSHKVVNLQEPLMQNKEICFSTGLSGTKMEFDIPCIEVHENYTPQNKIEKATTMLPTTVHDDKYEAISDDDEPVKALQQPRSEQELSPVVVKQIQNANIGLGRIISPTLLDIKKRVNNDDYVSLKDFNHDMRDVIERTTSEDLKVIYKDLFTETFPWFDCENNCLQPNLEVEGEQDDTESLKDQDFTDNKGIKNAIQSIEKPMDTMFLKLEAEGDNIEEDFLECSPIVDSRTCVLCKVVGDGLPSMEGRLLYCGQNDWIHANCALWSAEVFEEIDGSLQNVHSAISRGKMIKCAACEAKGASVGCCAKNCSETYHYACARKLMCAFMDDKRVFCPTHGRDVPRKSLQKDSDFELTRPVYVELDKKKKRYSEINKVQFLLGSLTVQNLGKIVPSVSDFEEFLMPVDFSCTRLFWSSKKPTKIVKYTIRTKLILAEPLPGFDFGVNITVDHTMDIQVIERVMAEIGAWHESLESNSGKPGFLIKSETSPIKLGNTVTLEDLAVKQVVEYLVDSVCKQEQQDEEEPQNTADLLPPELKDAIFEDLNHDLLDGISMQDIFPNPYEDLVAMDLKSEFYNSIAQTDDKSNDRSDFIDELLNSRLEPGNKEIKRSKSDMLLQSHSLKTLTTSRGQQRSSSLPWSNKSDTNLLSCTLKRSKMGKTSTVTGKMSPVQRSALLDNPMDAIKETDDEKKTKSEPNTNDSICDESQHSSELEYQTTSPKQKDDSTMEKVPKTDGYYTDVIDFYTKIQCSPISQLDGTTDWSDNDSNSSSRPQSPRDQSNDFTPIQQLDGTEENHRNNDNVPRSQAAGQFIYRASGTESTYTVTIAGNSVSGQPELVMRPLDDNSGISGQMEQQVRCDRCQCTYRNKESYDRHVPSCDMMSTSESESENPKSPENRTLTTLQNAFQGAFAQPMIIHAGVMTGNESTAKAENISARRTSINTRQITINGTIVETPSPGPSNEMTMTITEQMKSGTVIFDQNKTSNVQVSSNQPLMSSPQIVVTPQVLLPPKTSTSGQKMMAPQIITQPGILPYNICVKTGTGNNNIQQIQNNTDMAHLLSGGGGLQVISSNANQVLAIPSNQSGNITSMIQGKNQVANFPNLASASSISLPVNSIQGMPNTSIIQNIQPMIRPQVQGNPTIVVPTMTAQRLASPNSQTKQPVMMSGTPQKSPKKQPASMQPKPVYQAANRGRGRPLPKPPTIKRHTKMEKTFSTINQSPLGNGNTVIQLQTNSQTGQPSIIVQPMPNQNIMSAYVEALSQQQNQNMQYIATIAPQGDFKGPTQFISQGGLVPQTFQIQQTESGGLVAVPSGGIPVLLPQGNVGILPQTIQQGTILPQGTIQAQGIISQGPNGPTILPQAIHTQNGATIIPQGTIQGLTPNNMTSQTATLLPNTTLQTGGATVVPQSGIGNGQTTIIPNALPSQGNTIISSAPGATILPQGTILPQFCNDQVLLGSTPTLEMVTDPSGCMYLTTTQPVYYGLETIVQNTVMSSQQFVSTAMQGVLAQNSSFSATTTQVFQASKIEPIVEVPTGYVVVNNVGETVAQSTSTANIVNPQPTQSTAHNIKNVKSNIPNLTLQPLPEKSNNRQTPKVVQMSSSTPVPISSQSGSMTVVSGRQNINPITSQINNMTLSSASHSMQRINNPKPTNCSMSPNVTLVSSTGQPLILSQSVPNSISSFTMQSIPLSQPIVSSSIVASSTNKNNVKVENAHMLEISGNLQDTPGSSTISVTQSTKSPTPWKQNSQVSNMISTEGKITDLQNMLKSTSHSNTSSANMHNNLTSARHHIVNDLDKNSLSSIANTSSVSSISSQFDQSGNVSYHSSPLSTASNMIQINAGNIFSSPASMSSNFDNNTSLKLSKINALSKTDGGHLNFSQEIMPPHSQHGSNEKPFQNLGPGENKINSESLHNSNNVHKLNNYQVTANMNNAPSISIIPHNVMRSQVQSNQNNVTGNNQNQMGPMSNHPHSNQVHIMSSTSNEIQNSSCQENVSRGNMNNTNENILSQNSQHDMNSNVNTTSGMQMISHENSQVSTSNQIHIMNGQIQHRQTENNQMQQLNQASSNRYHDPIVGGQLVHNQTNILSNRNSSDNSNVLNQAMNLHNMTSNHGMNRTDMNDLNHMHIQQPMSSIGNVQNNRMMIDNMQTHSSNNMGHQMHPNRLMDSMHNNQHYNMQQMNHHMSSSNRTQIDTNMHVNQQISLQQNRQIDNMGQHHQHQMSNMIQMQNNRSHSENNIMGLHQHMPNQMHNRQPVDNNMHMHHMSVNNTMETSGTMSHMHSNRLEGNSLTMHNVMNPIQTANRNQVDSQSSLMQHQMSNLNNMNVHNNLTNSLQMQNANHNSMNSSMMHIPNITEINKSEIQSSCSGSCSNSSSSFSNNQTFDLCSNMNLNNNSCSLNAGNMMHNMNVSNTNTSNNVMSNNLNNSGLYGNSSQTGLTTHDMLIGCNSPDVTNLLSGNNNHMMLNNSQSHGNNNQNQLMNTVPNTTQININSCSLTTSNAQQNQINNINNQINRNNVQVSESSKYTQEVLRAKNMMGPPPNTNLSMPNISSDCSKINVLNNEKQNHTISVSNQIGYMQMNSQNNRVINLPERNRLDNTNNENSINQHISSQHNIRVVTNNGNNNVSDSLTFQQKTENNSTMINVPFQAIPNSAPMNINVNSSNNTVNITVQNNLVDPKIASKAAADIGFPLQANNNILQNQNNTGSMICIPVQNNTISLPTQNSSSISLPKAPPTQQSGIPTNVVNPMTMRPMNRVLPLHRDGHKTPNKGTIANNKSATPPAAPRPRPGNDMPDLNIKEECLESDLEKAIEESKHMIELEATKREKEENDASQDLELSSGILEANTSSASINIDITSSDNMDAIPKMTALPDLDAEMIEVEPPKVLAEREPNRSIIPNRTTNAPVKMMKRSLGDKKTETETVPSKKQSKVSKSQENKHLQPDPPKDDGPKLIYEVTSEDGFNYTSSSLTDLWAKVVEAVQNARKQIGLPLLEYNLPSSLSGAHLLGLNNNALRYLVEQLPGANRCSKYKACHGRELSSWDNDLDLGEGFKESPWGSARTGPITRKPNHDMFSWMASPFREEPPSLGAPEGENSLSRRLATLPPAMRFRQLKETSKVSVGVYRSHIHGRGLFCKRDIEEGDMVIEYAGEVIRAVLADQREKKYEAMSGRRGVGGCYMFRIDDNLVVDATLKGNSARFINHSCDPNCYSRVVDIHGHKHILIFALRRITIGEELTYDYKFPFEEVKIPCTCGAKKCRKYLN